ncbi:MAG: polysaccharide biosynthesis C-terminal domain-containing protein [Chitinophagales bacterium]
MGIVFRQSAKNWIVVCMGALLGALIIWLSTKYIPQRQYGFIGSLTNYAVTISQVLLLGLNSTLVVYIHRYADDDRKRKLLLTICLIFPAIFAGIVSILYYILRSWILHHFQPDDQPYMERYFMWLPVFTLLFIYLVILEQYLGSQMKVAVSAFMREVVLRVTNIILILLFAFGYVNFTFLVAGTILIYLLPIFIFLLLALKTKGFGFSFQLNSFTWSEYKDLIHFSWYHFLLSISVLLMGYMDALLLPFYDHKGFNSVAVYRVAVFLISFLLLPSKALIPASFTVLAKAFSENDHAKARDIFVRASINMLIPTFGIAILLCCNLQNAVAVIKNGYSEIIPVFLILFIGRIIDCATGMNDQVLSITNHYKFNFYLSLALMLLLFVMIRLLVPHYGIYGAAWSTTITIVIFNILKYLFVWKKLGMQPFSNKTILVAIAALPALAGGYFFPYFFDPARHIYVHTFIDVIMRSTVIIIIYLLMLLWLKPSKDLEEYIASIKKNKRLF